MTDEIAFVDLAAQQRRLGEKVHTAIANVLAHGQYVLGPEVAELESTLALRSGVSAAVTCSSGTDALMLTLLAWGVGPGDAVLVPAFTFVATAEAVALCGATPVFCDVGDEDFVLDPTQIGSAASCARAEGLTPRAVIAVGLYGQPVDESAVEVAAAAEGLRVLGDAAQSYGSTFGGRDTGAFGDATATSFFPAKPLGCFGDGGAVFTDDLEVADKLRSLRMHGFGAHRYEHVRIGTTARLDTIQAAVLLEKLKIFDDELAKRQRVADCYTEGLAQVVTVPRLAPGRSSAWAQYTVRVAERDRVVEGLRTLGIPVAVHYPMPLHHQPAYAMFPRAGSLATAEKLAEEVMSLPMHPYLEPSVQDRIIAGVRDVVGYTS